MSGDVRVQVLVGKEPADVRQAMAELDADEDDWQVFQEATKSRLRLHATSLMLVIWDVRQIEGRRTSYRIAAWLSGERLLVVTPEMTPALNAFQNECHTERICPSALEALGRLLIKITNSYAEAADEVERDAEQIQRRVLLGPRKGLWHEAYAVRQGAFFLRRQAMRLARMMDILRPSAVVRSDGERAALEEVHGEAEDLIDDLGEVLGSMADMVEANSAILDHRTNGIMKVLTVVSVVFMPPTLIASIYGMNFYIPEIHWRYGYAYSLILMALVVAGSLAWMHFNGWLRRDD